MSQYHAASFIFFLSRYHSLFGDSTPHLISKIFQSVNEGGEVDASDIFEDEKNLLIFENFVEYNLLHLDFALEGYSLEFEDIMEAIFGGMPEDVAQLVDGGAADKVVMRKVGELIRTHYEVPWEDDWIG